MSLDARIPDKVKIGGLVYKVLPNADLPQHNLMGQCRHMQSEIQIDPALIPDRQVCTLLHEILHAVDDQQKFGWSEDMIGRLEYVWFQILQDNRLHIDEPGEAKPAEPPATVERHCETCVSWHADVEWGLGGFGQCNKLHPGRADQAFVSVPGAKDDPEYLTYQFFGCNLYERHYGVCPSRQSGDRVR